LSAAALCTHIHGISAAVEDKVFHSFSSFTCTNKCKL